MENETIERRKDMNGKKASKIWTKYPTGQTLYFCNENDCIAMNNVLIKWETREKLSHSIIILFVRLKCEDGNSEAKKKTQPNDMRHERGNRQRKYYTFPNDQNENRKLLE